MYNQTLKTGRSPFFAELINGIRKWNRGKDLNSHLAHKGNCQNSIAQTLQTIEAGLVCNVSSRNQAYRFQLRIVGEDRRRLLELEGM
jgi:hypothetical protein